MVRIGLVGVGPGSIAQRFYLPSLKLVSGAEVVAVASRSGTSTGLTAPVFADWAEMLNTVSMDILFVLAPTSVHLPITMAAFQRGIHVLCEKPPALNLRDAETMVDTARRRDLNLLFGFNRRFAPLCLRLKKIAATRGCHSLVLEKARLHPGVVTPELIAELNRRWIAEAATRGAPVFEFAAHFFHLALWINGPVASYAFFPQTTFGSAVHVHSAGYLQHSNGAHTTIVYDQLGGSHRERAVLYGPAVTAEFGDSLFERNWLRLADQGQTDLIMGPEDVLDGSGFPAMCQHIVDCVANGRKVEPDPADAVEALRLALAFDPPVA